MFLLWLVGIPTILYQCLFRFLLLAFFVSLRAYCTFRGEPPPQVELEKGKLVVMNNRKQSVTNNQYVAQHLALAMLAVIAITSEVAICLEADVPIIEPFATLAKNVIATVTLGVPIEFNLGASDLMHSFGLLTWRTGFPLTMPSDFMAKSQDFYNRIGERVEESSVQFVIRKSLAGLKVDLDLIVDSIVEEVRRSDDGVYTDYTQTMVNGTLLEDACVDVGVQLKAYKTDLIYYRSIAEKVLGVPFLPTIASGVVNGANLTSTVMLMPVDHVTQLSDSAMSSVAPIVTTGLNAIKSPLSLFNFQSAAAPTAPEA